MNTDHSARSDRRRPRTAVTCVTLRHRARRGGGVPGPTHGGYKYRRWRTSNALALERRAS